VDLQVISDDEPTHEESKAMELPDNMEFGEVPELS
jgi:hypothetical protein